MKKSNSAPEMKFKSGFCDISGHALSYLMLLFLLVSLSSLVSADIMETREAKIDDKLKSEPKVEPVIATPKPEPEKKEILNQKVPTTTLPSVGKETESAHVNCSLPINKNLTICNDNDDGMVSYFLNKMSSNSGMLFRTMYVLLAVTGIVIIYFVIKAVRLRRRKSKSRKYGIITKHGDHGDMEMEPLGDGMDEDDDYTVFEMGRRK